MALPPPDAHGTAEVVWELPRARIVSLLSIPREHDLYCSFVVTSHFLICPHPVFRGSFHTWLLRNLGITSSLPVSGHPTVPSSGVFSFHNSCTVVSVAAPACCIRLDLFCRLVPPPSLYFSCVDTQRPFQASKVRRLW